MFFAIFGFAVSPLLKCRVSRFGRAIDIFGVAAPGASQHAVGGRVERFESFAARALGPLTVDVMLHCGAGELAANLIDKLRADAGCWGRRGHWSILPARWRSPLGLGIGDQVRSLKMGKAD